MQCAGTEHTPFLYTLKPLVSLNWLAVVQAAARRRPPSRLAARKHQNGHGRLVRRVRRAEAAEPDGKTFEEPEPLREFLKCSSPSCRTQLVRNAYVVANPLGLSMFF